MPFDATQSDAETTPAVNPLVAKLARQRQLAFLAIRRRRKILAAIGAAAQQPIQQTTVVKVGMRRDSWKQSVRCATTANVNLATGLVAGTTIDGVILVAEDRVLVRAQSDQKQNGIYVVPASGAASRAEDAEVGEHLLQATVGVQKGTARGKHVFVCTTDAPIIVGSTNIVWSDLADILSPLILIDGSQITDLTVALGKITLEGPTGSMIYHDGSSYRRLSPPGATSVLNHDGTAPFWVPG